MLVPATVDVVGDAYRIAAKYLRQTDELANCAISQFERGWPNETTLQSME